MHLGQACSATILSLLVSGVVSQCQAHFLWLVSDEVAANRKAIVFFGENAFNRDYHLPERLANLQAYHRNGEKVQSIKLESVDEDDLVGLVSHENVGEDGVVETSAQYGIYHGTLLNYYAKHFLSADPNNRSKVEVSKSLLLDAIPSLDKNGLLSVRVFWKGKPAPGASVSLMRAKGPPLKEKTSDVGDAVFREFDQGLLGLLVNVVENDRSGELDGKKYSSVTHYATITFLNKSHSGAASPKAHKQARRPQNDEDTGHGDSRLFTTIPAAVASFGGAVCDGFLYVYGGHIGTAHVHSRANLWGRFCRVPLGKGGEWEYLPFETPVQGLALVPHNGMLYRVGGMTARNDLEEDEDVHSTTDFARYDPGGNQWQDLPRLPQARSSHDAVVIDGKLYVVGGWNLSGDASNGAWHEHGLVMDLTSDSHAWVEVPQPFQRRALAAAELKGKLVVIGGLDEIGDVSKDVNIYDPKTATWSRGDEFPGEGKGMKGFGVSAWGLNGQLFASGVDGTVYQLSDDRGSWKSCGRLVQPRFFHRLLPGADNTLLAAGGASRSGHLDGVEQFNPFAVVSGD